jgi:hypothetical protein
MRTKGKIAIIAGGMILVALFFTLWISHVQSETVQEFKRRPECTATYIPTENGYLHPFPCCDGEVANLADTPNGCYSEEILLRNSPLIRG